MTELYPCDLLIVCLKTIVHLNLKLVIFCRHTASFKILISNINFRFWTF